MWRLRTIWMNVTWHALRISRDLDFEPCQLRILCGPTPATITRRVHDSFMNFRPPTDAGLCKMLYEEMNFVRHHVLHRVHQVVPIRAGRIAGVWFPCWIEAGHGCFANWRFNHRLTWWIGEVGDMNLRALPAASGLLAAMRVPVAMASAEPRAKTAL